ncbi:MAG TPA: glycoside hydrolase family 97 N-terminal domain-containing protein, partial [Steroidobacteraceae bacterium]|nr:glycoside hydrolase family 97 N-terminal domain-containing protein [Steroidobacteraceae bacterium]
MLMRALSGLLLAILALPATAETFRLRAPAEALEAVIRADDTLTLEVRYRGRTVVRTPAIGLDVDGHLRANALPRLSGNARRKVDETIRPAVPEKRAVIPDRYNELRLSFGPKLAATFRVYDDGVAYRFETAIDGEVIVRNESAGLRLGVDDSLWIALVNCRNEPGVDCFQSSYEENYQQLAAQAVPDGRLGYLPITVQTAGAYLGFTESDLRDYPGLWLRHVPSEPALAGDFPRYPLEEKVSGGEFKQSLVTRRADYLARTTGTRTFPWRVMMVSPDAAGLLGNDLVYRLASPLELQDVSWIRPGQSTEEWITSRLLHGVNFTSGLNTATYRYYIDFAAEYGVEYMMFDAGWSDADDNTKLNPA